MAEKVTVIINGEEYVSKAAKQAGSAIEDLEKKTSTSSKKSKLSITDLAAAYYLLSKAVNGVIDFVSNLTTEYGKQEKAEKQLQNAIRNNPLMTGESFKNLKNYADQMQALSGVADDVILQQSAIAASMGLTEEQIKKITAAAIDWQATGRISFEQGFEILSRSLSGNAGQIGRYLPLMGDMTEEQLKAGAAIEYVAKSFDGMAASMQNTVLGTRALRDAAVGDMMEAVGKQLSAIEIAFNNVVTRISKGLTSAINGGLEEADTNKWFRDVLIGMVKLVADVKRWFDQAGLDIKFVFENIWFAIKSTAYETLKTWALALEKMTGQYANLGAIYQALGMGNTPQREISNARSGSNVEEAYQLWLRRTAGGASSDDAIKEILKLYRPNVADANDPIMQLIGTLMILPSTVQDAVQQGAKEGMKEGASGGETDPAAVVPALQEVEAYTPTIPLTWLESFAATLQEALGNILTNIQASFMPDVFAGSIMKMIMSIENVAKVLDPIGTALDGVRQVIEPVLNTVLQPLVDVLTQFGQLIGTMLVPVLKILTPIVDAVVKVFQAVMSILQPFIPVISVFAQIIAIIAGALLQPIVAMLGILEPILKLLIPVLDFVTQAFVWLYNYAIRPFVNGVLFVLNLMHNIVATIWNAIAGAINFLLGWLGVHLGYMSYRDLTEGFLEELAYEKPVYNLDQTNSTNIYGGNTSVQNPPDIYLYQYYNAPIVGAGGMTEVGQYVVAAIQEYYGGGGRVMVLEAPQ